VRLPFPFNAGAAGTLALLLQVVPVSIDADRRMQDARDAVAKGQALEQRGQYPDARTLFEQALSINESVRGPDDPSVARVVFELAGNALQTQDNARSRALYERALKIFGATSEPDEAYALMSRSRLALLDQRTSQPRRAEATLREVLPALERAVGAEHPWYLQSLVTFANLRQNAGDLNEAERLDRQILASVERTGQTGTLLEAGVLNNLADVRRARGDYAGAEPLFRRSIALGESLLGSDSLFVATGLQNVGIMARERKDYRPRWPRERALAIREHLLARTTRSCRCAAEHGERMPRPATIRRRWSCSSGRPISGKAAWVRTRAKRCFPWATSPGRTPAWATSSTRSRFSGAPTRFSSCRCNSI
jgi:tetratricopeptide (TPR) repeat protein